MVYQEHPNKTDNLYYMWQSGDTDSLAIDRKITWIKVFFNGTGKDIVSENKIRMM